MRTRIIHLVLLTLALAGCYREPLLEENGILLNLVLEDPQTKTERNGDGALNENVLSSTVDIFFYNESTLAITKEALHVVRSGSLVQIPTTPDDISTIFSGTTAVHAKCGVFVVANFSGTYQGTAGSRTITQIKESLLPAPNWETLPQASFVMTGEGQAELTAPANSTIPVQKTISLTRVAAKVTFDVTVAENASGDSNWSPDTEHMSVYMVYAMRKATLGGAPVNMPASDAVAYEQGGTVVYPQYVDKNLYDTGTTRSRNRNKINVQCKVYSTAHDGEKPFYTYPCTWVTGSSMEPYLKLIIPWNYNNTTRKYYYKIPFAGNSLERNHWYHISIDVQILGTEQADPPQVGITYSIADWSGSMDTTEAGDFTSPTSVPAAVITSHYLNIPITEYVLYNEDELVIPMQTSHDVEVVGFSVDTQNAYQAAHQIDANFVGNNPRLYNPFTTTLLSAGSIMSARPNYSAATTSADTHSFTSNTAPDANGWALTVNGRESLTFSHLLNRDLESSSYDVAPYTLRFRVRHQGDASGYYVDITIEQRPSIIIRPYANSGGNSHYGYAFVNGGQNNESSNGNWSRSGFLLFGYSYSCTDGTWTGQPNYPNSDNITADEYWDYYLGSAPNTVSESDNNSNTNMYVIETTVLPSSGSGNLTHYVLGDPRTRTVDNLAGANGEWSGNKASVTGTTRRLTNYYPAGDTAYDNFISPKLRIASSYGSTYSVTYDNARRRCASYQEDGLPAGRWRLPTVAEIEYIALLNTDGKIFRLLGSQSRYNSKGKDDPTTDYWCNSGYMTIYNGTNDQWPANENRIPSPVHNTEYASSDTKYVRCVYDDWYWEKTTYATLASKGTFTWGDQNRNDVTIAN